MYGTRQIKGFFITGILISLFPLFSPSFLLAYEVIPVVEGGTLEGTIKFKGEPPSNQSHLVVNNPDFCGASVQDETYHVNASNHGVKNVVVSIEGIQKGKKELVSTVMIENKKCHFNPHVMAGMIGDNYEIKNTDPVLHNTHLYMEETSILNVAMPSGGRNIKRSIGQTGVIKVKCDAHKFMLGWIYVSDSPYMAISDVEGNYKISDIPEGKYKIRIWHEGFSSKEREVIILKGKRTELSIDMN
ncbi:MAG: hypothetical protein HY200_09980 [Nitrospirae bacterium]|nr:hypothetical protein [Nitrospirota bacterium]MBI3595274.1 hypothetical protein [Nitrospirota bacterium]